MSGPAYERIKIAEQGAVLTITLSVPERRNAIGPAMASELLHALGAAMNDDAVRVIVLTGEGKAFCAGGDFAELQGGGAAATVPHKGDFADLLLALWRADKPVIARVNGVAMGGGLGLVAACTFAIAAEGVMLGTPEIDVGLFPMMIMAALTRILPRRRVAQMMLTGERMTAEEGAKIGLVNAAVAPDALDGAVRALSDKLASKSPLVMRLGLRAVAAQEDLSIEAALPMLRDRLAECLATNDAREGLTAFVQKRAPAWTGT